MDTVIANQKGIPIFFSVTPKSSLDTFIAVVVGTGVGGGVPFPPPGVARGEVSFSREEVVFPVVVVVVSATRASSWVSTSRGLLSLDSVARFISASAEKLLSIDLKVLGAGVVIMTP